MCLQIGCVDEELPPWLMLGDCLEKMREIPDSSVDMILADLPYGTTACSWDVVIPFEPLWEQYWRILKRDAAILLFSAQPFTTKLISSQIQLYRYSWVWKKEKGTNFMSAKLMPLLKTEDINVFSRASSNCRSKNLIPYYPQNLVRIDKYLTNCKSVGGQLAKDRCAIFNAGEEYIQEFSEYPNNVLEFNISRDSRKSHPTQKPVPLLEYLIKTYTNENEVVLDNVMGSGSTGVACMNTKRKFIGIERDEYYYKIAEQRILRGDTTSIENIENIKLASSNRIEYDDIEW